MDILEQVVSTDSSARNKWKKVRPNLQVVDKIILKDSTFQKPTWPLARVEKTFPGPDILFRVVGILCQQNIQKTSA